MLSQGAVKGEQFSFLFVPTCRHGGFRKKSIQEEILLNMFQKQERMKPIMRPQPSINRSFSRR
jgi:hypothetical protein